MRISYPLRNIIGTIDMHRRSGRLGALLRRVTRGEDNAPGEGGARNASDDSQGDRLRWDATGEEFTVALPDPATSELQVRRQIPVLEGVE